MARGLSTSKVLSSKILSGVWRHNAINNLVTDGELTAAAPLLLRSGAGALAWCRVRVSELRDSPIGFELQQAYRHHTLEAARHERDITTIFALLRSHGIEPMLIKGWSIARLYPEKGMRPYDDTDLIVRRDQLTQAQAIVDEQKSTEFGVDLQDALEEFGFGNEDDLFEGSRLVRLGDIDIRVPSHEDSLRIVCVHFLRHGAFRPLWLCDVALLVESTPANFDWGRCLGKNKRVADWVACAIGLAHKLLGARIYDTPVKSRAENLPSWLVPTVLKQWEKPFAHDHGVGRHRAPMASYFRNPSGVLADTLRRWPNPIEATVYMRGAFNDLPRFPFQLGEFASRAAKFIVRLPKDYGFNQKVAEVDMTKNRKQATHESDGKGLRVIAVFKLTKGLLLLAVGIGAIKLLHRDLSELATNWITTIRVDPDNRLIHGLITKLGLIKDRKLEELSIGSFFYSGLLLTEGVGLWLKKRWAEYFTIITTCSLIPLELYEIERRVTVTRVVLFAVNVAIVWYLVIQLRKNHK